MSEDCPIPKRRRSRSTTVLKDALGELGREQLQNIWNNAIESAKTDNNEERILVLEEKVREYGRSDKIPIRKVWGEEFHCIIHRGHRMNGYPVTSVRLSRNGSAKIALHQLAILQGDWESPIVEKGMTASHLCHNPMCIRPEHLCTETIHQNSSRNHCQSWIRVDGKLYHVCPHEPKCLFLGNFLESIL